MADKFVPRSLTLKPKSHLLPKRKNHNLKPTFNPPSKCLTLLENDDRDNSSVVEQLKEHEGKNASSCETEDNFVAKCGGETEQVDSDGDEVVYFSKHQRLPDPGEPVCVICGRYGEYICDETEADVCSKECKAKNLHERKMAETKQASNKDPTLYLAEKEELKTAEHCSSNPAGSNMEDTFQPYSYKMHPEVASLRESQIHDLRNRMEITVKGEQIERPILEFSHCNLDEKLLDNLKSLGYETPTPIQMQVISVALCTCDVLACAQTGSGKTAAFLIPMIIKIHHEMGKYNNHL